MSEGRKKRYYTRQKSREMFLKIGATKQANIQAALAETLRRETDPLEIAKLALQRARMVVYENSVHDPESNLIVVGRRLLTEREVIALAERYRNPKEV